MARRATSKTTEEKRALRKERIQALPISRIIPNLTTLIALAAGLSAVRFALLERYEMAVFAIIAAAILDAMDGRLARMLGTASQFGAELDSLSDFVCFGVAPGLVIYIVTLQQWNGFGWAVMLFYVACMGFRLARFNTANLEEDEKPEWAKHYFTGVPAPAGALLVLWPMMFSFSTDIEAVMHNSYLNAFNIVCVGLLLISRIPTFSGKGYKVSPQLLVPIMLVAAITIAALVTAPWWTLLTACAIYLGLIPFSLRSYKSRK
jgi:CDP-diacylglycerol--serine O-phosphatidyltransferase